MTTGTSLSRRAALGLFGATLVCPRASLAGGVEAISGTAFGTRWRIAAPAGSGIARLAPAISALFDEIDRQFSPWRADSAISRFNAGPAGAQAADPALVDVTTAALDIARRSRGAFDPTVGPLVARWGFGPIDRGGSPDWRALSVAPATLKKARADLTLDLCGIAKGWALDRAAALARSRGFDDLLLDLGGEFAALGRHPDGRDWRVAVESPVSSRPAQAVLRLAPGTAVATSGTGIQSYKLNGRLYSHIIDPATGSPLESGLRSVTVIAGDAMTADGWATALIAAGDRAGPALAEMHGVAALFLVEDNGVLRKVRTGSVAGMII